MFCQYFSKKIQYLSQKSNRPAQTPEIKENHNKHRGCRVSLGCAQKAKSLVYILVNGAANLSAETVKKNYRKRFGIEASYRSAKKVRGWTTSANAADRFVLIGSNTTVNFIRKAIEKLSGMVSEIETLN
jgi:hypothetical protein